MRNIKLLIVFLLSGILLTLSWPMRGWAFLIFFAWIPFFYGLYLISLHGRKKTSYFTFSFPMFLLWNVATTWWIWNSTIWGSLFAMIANSFLMALVVWIYGWVREKLFSNNLRSFLIFPFFWVSFEYLHYRWELAWPWLTLGNVFATKPTWVQWYEFTGVLGGSFWILFINLLLFFWLWIHLEKENISLKFKSLRNTLVGITLFTILVPLAYSYIRYFTYDEKSNPVRIHVVQPNIDPWEEEFNLTADETLDRLFNQLPSERDTSIDFILCPESILQEGMYEDQFQYSRSIPAIVNMLKTRFPRAIWITGASTYRVISPEEAGSATRRLSDGTLYEAYNSALYLDTSQVKEVYRKIKLVPGVERMPYKTLFPFLEKLTIDLGGISGTLGSSKEPVVFHEGHIPVGTVICYESAFGEFMADFVKKGAHMLFVITNDGWWGNTPGHRQHFVMSVLRAIETRRAIARSANTGISGAIDQRGNILIQTKYWEPAGFTVTLYANDQITFYVKYGDYLGRISVFASLLIVLATISFSLIRRKSV
ncbi:MAG: apolipoprotein N-acyltransferase [Bacteroidales bacterium]|nr:apolipoprotein N-acyltransferase [Bacteroidales bacterium]